MIPGPALADWLQDRAAQRRSYDRVQACVAKWSAHPMLNQLERALSLSGRQPPEALVALARRFIDDHGDDAAAMLREFIALSRIDPYFQPPLTPLFNDIFIGLMLFHHPGLTIGLGMTELDILAAKKTRGGGVGSINFTGQITLLRFIDAGGAVLSFWEAPSIEGNFVASAAGLCRKTGERAIRDGEEIVIDGRHESFVIEHAAGDMLYFQASVRIETAPVSVEFDNRTGAFANATSADEASSRIQTMASLLRAMDCREAMPVLEETLANPNFHVRWHVMREMLAIDAEAALPALRRMAADDPHPEVRAAARQTLDLFFGDSAPAESGVPCRA